MEPDSYPDNVKCGSFAFSPCIPLLLYSLQQQKQWDQQSSKSGYHRWRANKSLGSHILQDPGPQQVLRRIPHKTINKEET